MRPTEHPISLHDHPPWTGASFHCTGVNRAAELIERAQLDWEVDCVPARGVKRLPGKQPVRMELLRKARNTEEEDVLLGVVSSRYRPLQNRDAFKFFDEVARQYGAQYVAAGCIGSGERVWVQAKLPDVLRITGDDVCEKYLLLSNSHDGKGSVTLTFTPIRILCGNTLILAQQKGQQALRIRHNRNIGRRLREAAYLVSVTENVFSRAEDLFQALTRVHMSSDRLVEYLDGVLPRPEKQRFETGYPRRWREILEIFETPQEHGGRNKRTLWQAYNAITRHEDYRSSSEAGDGRRLHRTWFGSGAALKLRALRVAEHGLKTWI